MQIKSKEEYEFAKAVLDELDRLVMDSARNHVGPHVYFNVHKRIKLKLTDAMDNFSSNGNSNKAEEVQIPHTPAGSPTQEFRFTLPNVAK